MSDIKDIQQDSNSSIGGSSSNSSILSLLLKKSYEFTSNQKLRCLGSGSFGRVVLVEYQTTKYALKYFKRKEDAKKEVMALDCIYELTDLSKWQHIGHTNIVRYYGQCKYNGKEAILLEWVTRGSLWETMTVHYASLTCDRIIHILQGIARGVLALHELNMFHRDLKPGNVLLDNDYNAKITDFNTTKKVQDDNNTKNVGSDLFIADEVRRSRRYTKAVDVYSFGMICVCFLNIKPFVMINDTNNNNNNNEIYDIINNNNDNNNNKLIDLIKRCISKEEDKRPTFKMILDDLKDIKEDINVLDFMSNAIIGNNDFMEMYQARGKVKEMKIDSWRVSIPVDTRPLDPFISMLGQNNVVLVTGEKKSGKSFFVHRYWKTMTKEGKKIIPIINDDWKSIKSIIESVKIAHTATSDLELANGCLELFKLCKTSRHNFIFIFNKLKELPPIDIFRQLPSNIKVVIVKRKVMSNTTWLDELKTVGCAVDQYHLNLLSKEEIESFIETNHKNLPKIHLTMRYIIGPKVLGSMIDLFQKEKSKGRLISFEKVLIQNDTTTIGASLSSLHLPPEL
ncbi:hypothetical protein DFA_11174 [Cavenderia fasciculata]|uniref:non-specific serine/threonine protein kinase n=1 Tax=Cavenderia fasciculata TaxID=261658 RepID=F4QFA6_CACFS|nr:uncharacterized protein DFA_11174 [Cavenderia fasciculata]EGG13413.1 hypothetical protein DFA_11174 [Cavenderia fasciculata]|eukprot:XP_004350117.1 hypothetical protein DFA_11174 [Cavenderia fasciculata]